VNVTDFVTFVGTLDGGFLGDPR